MAYAPTFGPGFDRPQDPNAARPAMPRPARNAARPPRCQRRPARAIPTPPGPHWPALPARSYRRPAHTGPARHGARPTTAPGPPPRPAHHRARPTLTRPARATAPPPGPNGPPDPNRPGRPARPLGPHWPWSCNRTNPTQWPAKNRSCCDRDAKIGLNREPYNKPSGFFFISSFCGSPTSLRKWRVARSTQGHAARRHTNAPRAVVFRGLFTI
jgi:hypothetical protein